MAMIKNEILLILIRKISIYPSVMLIFFICKYEKYTLYGLQAAKNQNVLRGISTRILRVIIQQFSQSTGRGKM